MPGTKDGAKKAMTTLYSAHGFTETGHSKFHSQVGAIGGKKGAKDGTVKDGTVKGFALMPREKVSLAGQVGGRVSRKDRKLTYKERSAIYKEFRELSDMSKSSIIAKYGTQRPW